MSRGACCLGCVRQERDFFFFFFFRFGERDGIGGKEGWWSRSYNEGFGIGEVREAGEGVLLSCAARCRSVDCPSR